jgi:hypothetical protein
MVFVIDLPAVGIFDAGEVAVLVVGPDGWVRVGVGVVGELAVGVVDVGLLISQGVGDGRRPAGGVDLVLGLVGEASVRIAMSSSVFRIASRP